MPYIVHGNARRVLDVAKGRSHDYTYPEGLDLKPGSETHNMVLAKIMERAQAASTAISSRYPDWRRIDRTLTAYQYVDAKEDKVQDADSRRPVSIVFPYSYAMMETLLTYLTVAFFQDPLFKYSGVSPEDTIGCMLLELDIRLQSIRNKHPLALHTFFRDSLAYGVGAITPVWEVKRKWRRGKRKLGLAGEPAPREQSIFEGNRIDNIDQYRFLPDPNVPIQDIQKGEYVGWLATDNLLNILEEEFGSEGEVFNARYAYEQQGMFSALCKDEHERERGQQIDEEVFTNTCDRLYLYTKLIPKEWGLGDGEEPEKWLFSVLGDAIIIQAERTEFDHDMFPVAIASPDSDGYSSAPLSRLEVLYGLQHTLDFLFNSHIANVRKAVNNMIVVDPYLINVRDIEEGKEGAIIRMRRPAWGRGVKDAITQLNINDITKGNVADSEWIVNWMQKIAAADDSAMGVLRSGGPERLTQAEYSGTRSNAVSRLQRVAQLISWQGMQDLGYMMASHTQQYRSEDSWVEVTGDWQRKLMETFGVDAQFPERMRVSPDDIRIDYDCVVRDGSIPGGNFSPMFMKMFELVATNPQLQQKFDLFRMFAHIGQENGVKNIEDFRAKVNGAQTQMMPDAQVEQEAQAGNIVPFTPGEAVG